MVCLHEYGLKLIRLDRHPERKTYRCISPRYMVYERFNWKNKKPWYHNEEKQ